MFTGENFLRWQSTAFHIESLPRRLHLAQNFKLKNKKSKEYKIMKIYNETKTQELNETEIDREKGYLKDDKIKTAHHDAVPAKTVDEQIAELKAQGRAVEQYDNQKDKWYVVKTAYINRKKIENPTAEQVSQANGKDVEEIKAIPAKDAYDDEEAVQVYVPYTEAELKERADSKRIAELKAELVKVKEDIEQVEYGLVRDDYEEKKARAAEIINELRVLEGKEPREIREQIL